MNDKTSDPNEMNRTMEVAHHCRKPTSSTFGYVSLFGGTPKLLVSWFLIETSKRGRPQKGKRLFVDLWWSLHFSNRHPLGTTRW